MVNIEGTNWLFYNAEVIGTIGSEYFTQYGNKLINKIFSIYNIYI